LLVGDGPAQTTGTLERIVTLVAAAVAV